MAFAAQHIDFIFHRKRVGNPESPFQGTARKFREIQGFLLKNRGMLKKGQSREFREIHSGDPKRAFWDGFPWRMRTAKVDMLGTGETLILWTDQDCKRNP